MIKTEKFYYVSFNKLNSGQTIKPYGCEHAFKSMFDFCYAMIDRFPDKIPYLSIFEDFMMVKGIAFTNPYNLGSMLREVLAEQVRLSDFPDRPCRIGSTFLFNQYMDAYKFLFEYRQGDGWIYQCQSPATKIFIGDMHIITHARLAHTDISNGYQSFKADMRRYWEAAEHLVYPETISWDPVTIIKPSSLAHQYDTQTGRFFNSTHVPLDPIGKLPLVPFGATLITPDFVEGKTPFFRNGTWINE